jgi:hypothetical protein
MGVIVLIVNVYVFKSMIDVKSAMIVEIIEEISATTSFFAYAANEGKL